MQEILNQTAYINSFPSQMDYHHKSRIFYAEMADRFIKFSVSVTHNERGLSRWETDGGYIREENLGTL